MNWLGYVAIGVLLLAVGGFVGIVEGPKPQIRGTIKVDGLTDTVEIFRDQWGIPHIFAGNEEDLFFAQGFATAQDRLWQLELSRRLGAGTLSEVFGELALDADKAIRTLGLNRAAQGAVDALSTETERRLHAYINGINAWISRNHFPLEFMILGFKPEPWQPVDVFHVTGGMAMTLQDAYNTIIKRANAQAILPPELFDDINAPYDNTGVFGVTPSWNGEVVAHHEAPLSLTTPSLQTSTLASLNQFADAMNSLRRLMPLGEGIGSNAWVVDGSLTDTGMPYLANDPHLPNRQPATWYEVHLNAPGWHVTGASLPGVPGIVIGHNESIAWGVTNGYLATQDLFIEHFNPDGANTYQFEGEWRPLKVIHEHIHVKGQSEPVAHDVVLTHHGPVITALLQRDEPISLGWTFIDPQGMDQLGGLLAINQANDWETFRQGVAQVPFDLNFVYADVEGNIGYQLSGQLPQRTSAYTGLPVEGWTGEHEWMGLHSIDDLPHTINPDTHFVATANHRPFGPELVGAIPGEWSAPFRAARITEQLMQEKVFDLESMRLLQADAYNEPFHRLAQWMDNMDSQEEMRSQALDLIKNWDGIVREGSQAPVILDGIIRRLTSMVFHQRLGDDANFIGFQGGVYWLLHLAESNPNSAWFDQPATPGSERFGDILLTAFHKTIEDFEQTAGPLDIWTWGRMKAVTFSHPLGGAPVIGGFFNRTTPTAGGRFTVNRDNASYRMIVDLADLNRSISELTTGQSGHPFSKHYDDQLEDWRTVNFHPMLWVREAIEQQRKGLLKLAPLNN